MYQKTRYYQSISHIQSLLVAVINNYMQKYESIILNDINGNIKDRNRAIKKLTKIELIDFIEYTNMNYESHPRFETIKIIYSALNN